MKTGRTAPRDEVHREGIWHGAFHCLIMSSNSGRPCALFQRRSPKKLIAPDRFDVSVGGHYASGEDATIAGPREIREELGLDVRFDDLVPLGKRTFVYCFTPGVQESEFQDVFLLARDIKPLCLTLQEDEVSAILEMDIEQGIKLFAGGISRATGMQYTGGASGSVIEVTADEFVPCLDRYYLKLLLLAKRYLKGEREHLVI